MAPGLATAHTFDTAATAFEHPSPRPVDLVHLRRFTFGDKDLENEILGLFMEQTPRTISLLRDATSPEQWKMAAHTLKGAARAVGAWRLARMGEQAERMTYADTDADQRAAMIERVQSAASEAEGFIRGILR